MFLNISLFYIELLFKMCFVELEWSLHVIDIIFDRFISIYQQLYVLKKHTIFT